MAYKARKTEHSGPKKGRGAYWGPKYDAKKESNKLRRLNIRKQVEEALQVSLGITCSIRHCA